MLGAISQGGQRAAQQGLKYELYMNGNTWWYQSWRGAGGELGKEAWVHAERGKHGC